jgi:flagellar biosynthesis regulator FlaF
MMEEIMNEDMEKCEDNLRELCNKMICLLDQLRDKGLIHEEEYKRQVNLKKRFLNNTY